MYIVESYRKMKPWFYTESDAVSDVYICENKILHILVKHTAI